MHSKIDVLYHWFQQNLEGRRAATAQTSETVPEASRPAADDALLFTVSIGLEHDPKLTRVLCPTAGFHSNWDSSPSTERDAESIFRCHCRERGLTNDHSADLQVTRSSKCSFDIQYDTDYNSSASIQRTGTCRSAWWAKMAYVCQMQRSTKSCQLDICV